MNNPPTTPVGPTVTIGQIETQIADEHYFTAADGVRGVAFTRDGETNQTNAHESLGLLTICVLVLKNGFTVVGTSACAAPENFDPEKGKEIAKSKAMDQMWSLLGFELKTYLHLQSLEQASAPAKGAEGDRQAEGHDAVGTGPAEVALIENLEAAAHNAEEIDHFTIDDQSNENATRAEPFGDDQEKG